MLQAPVEDFHCALQKKICLQGRLYLFQHHVCFYSNLFGFVKAKVIPLKVCLQALGGLNAPECAFAAIPTANDILMLCVHLR